MRPLRGILYKLISVVLFIGMYAFIKTVADQIPPGQVVFYRSFFAIPVIVVWLLIRRELSSGLKVHSVFHHFRRGSVGALAMGLSFGGLAYLPLPDVTAIGYAAPLLTVVFAAIFLKEKVRIFRIASVCLGLVGVAIVLAPTINLSGAEQDNHAALGAGLVLAGAVCAAFAQISIRAMIDSETTSAIVFWFSVSSSLFALLTLPFGWVWPSAWESLMLIAAGIMGGFGQIYLTSSYREAQASLVAPFDYASIVLSIALGYWLFSESPSASMLIGASIIVFAGILIIWRERQLGLERARQRKATTHQS